MPWRYALLYPDDSEKGWRWLSSAPFGRSVLERISLLLKRSGVERLSLRGSNGLTWDGDEPPQEEPILLIRGGLLWKQDLLHWFDEMARSKDPSCLTLPEGKAFMASCPYGLWKKLYAPSETFPEGDFLRITPPTHLLPVPYWDEEGLLELAGKPSDRPHVVWVRRKLLPFLKFCSKRGIDPNAITWLGFGVHMLGCIALLPKSYFLGLLATTLLILSWVLDCADGSLARVTMKESPYGKKLDTILGNISNLTLFGALIIREYSNRPLLALLLMLVILSGILIAYNVHERVSATIPKKPPSRISSLLTKINHRDYAILLFALALFDALKVFIWISLIGVHAYWIIDLTTSSLKGPKEEAS
ncbi:MAG: CDP-alcohol phosphatidyltransferase family protein [Syntrophobacterales bacterium]|nr:CDP-alcohol phosphatidyltransferase family protein [Syntrophobacterales bacterium]